MALIMSGSTVSSESIKVTYLPVAILRPVLRAADKPWFF